MTPGATATADQRPAMGGGRGWGMISGHDGKTRGGTRDVGLVKVRGYGYKGRFTQKRL